MIHCFKSAKQKLAYDTVSGAVIKLTSLEYKMLQAIQPPLSPLCPSSLRYELAKYDSADVSEAYDRIYALYLEDVLSADNENDSKKHVRIGEPYGLTDADAITHEIVSLLGGDTPELIIQHGVAQEVVESICAILCKNG